MIELPPMSAFYKNLNSILVSSQIFNLSKIQALKGPEVQS